MRVYSDMASCLGSVASSERDGRRSLFIASEVRCGSTFVAETLAYELNRSHGFEFWDLAKEHFGYVDENTSADEVLATWRDLFLDGSGFVASKFMCKALSMVHRLARQSEAVREAFFGEGAHWIVLRRSDRVEQAVSLALAKKTGAYHFYDDPGQAPDCGATLTPEEIDEAFKAVALSDVYLEVFSRARPTRNKLAFEYQEFMEDQVGHLNRIYAMCGFPTLDPPSFVNQSKIKRTGIAAKRAASEQFRSWFLENHV